MFRGAAINPFTAPSCKISGLKNARKRPKNSIFSVLITDLFSVLCVLIKILSHASAKKRPKGLKGLKFRTFISFSSDIMADKRLSERKIGAIHILFSSVNQSCHIHSETFTVGWSIRSACVSYSSYY